MAGPRSRHAVDPEKARAVILELREWLRAGHPDVPTPERGQIATAVRWTARTLAAAAPGASVEVRVPPFVAVQCVAGPRHTRGTPPNVVETDPRTWLRLATGLLSFEEAAADGRLQLSGSRAGEVANWLPLVPLNP